AARRRTRRLRRARRPGGAGARRAAISLSAAATPFDPPPGAPSLTLRPPRPPFLPGTAAIETSTASVVDRNLGAEQRAVRLRARDAERAAQRLDPVGQPDQAGPALRLRAAAPIVLDLHDQRSVLAARAQTDVRRLGVLHDVRERLRDDEVRRDLDGRMEALVGHVHDVD